MNMKKLAAAAMALSMAMSMAVSADTEQIPNQDTVKQPGQSSTIDVQAELKENPDRGNIYSVDLSWDSMVFTYTANVKYTWQPKTHTYYSERTGGSWDKSTSKITATNHSNAAVNVAFGFTAQNGFAGAFYDVDTENNNQKTSISSITLNAGEVNKPNAADTKTVTFKLDKMPTNLGTDAKIGEIKLTITANEGSKE